MRWKSLVADILKGGISLENEGIDNWALTEAHAISAIKKLEESRISLVGIDVYYIQKNGFKRDGACLGLEQSKHEEYDDFVERSANESLRFIEEVLQWDSSKKSMPYFVLYLDNLAFEADENLELLKSIW